MTSTKGSSSSGDDDEQNRGEGARGWAPVRTQDEGLSGRCARDEGASAGTAAGGEHRARLAADRMENRLHQPAGTGSTQDRRAVSRKAFRRAAVQLGPEGPDRG